VTSLSTVPARRRPAVKVQPPRAYLRAARYLPRAGSGRGRPRWITGPARRKPIRQAGSGAVHACQAVRSRLGWRRAAPAMVSAVQCGWPGGGNPKRARCRGIARATNRPRRVHGCGRPRIVCGPTPRRPAGSPDAWCSGLRAGCASRCRGARCPAGRRQRRPQARRLRLRSHAGAGRRRARRIQDRPCRGRCAATSWAWRADSWSAPGRVGAVGRVRPGRQPDRRTSPAAGSRPNRWAPPAGVVEVVPVQHLLAVGGSGELRPGLSRVDAKHVAAQQLPGQLNQVLADRQQAQFHAGKRETVDPRELVAREAARTRIGAVMEAAGAGET
jgi:hypothetical protein